MSIRGSADENVFQLSLWRASVSDTAVQKQQNTLVTELQASLGREKALQKENGDLLRRHDAHSLEFEHRLSNGLQLIAGLLCAQSRTATPEAAMQLTIAAGRIVAFGLVHRRLHFIDHHGSVEFLEYLRVLCEALSGLLCQEPIGHVIRVEGAEVQIPAALAIPLGFIVNELVTNAVKYAKSNITVGLETTPTGDHSLSVLDDGPGLPEGFDSAHSKGLGMKIVRSFVKEIGGELHILPGENGRGTRFRVTFSSSRDGRQPQPILQPAD